MNEYNINIVNNNLRFCESNKIYNGINTYLKKII